MLLRSLVISVLTFTLTACNLSGTGEKGPFKESSNVSLSKLNAQANPIVSQILNTTVSSNNGTYSFTSIGWNDWAQLQVTGQYFNEFTASTSADVITLDTITKKDKTFDTANIHIFSHLAAARIRQRVANGQNRLGAWKDTQIEMKQLFGLKNVSQNIHRGVEQLSLQKGSGRYRKDNANLLLFTGSFLAVGGDSASLELLATDFADDGQFNGVATSLFNSIAAMGATDGLLGNLSSNLNNYGIANPPNNGDMPQLPLWVNQDTIDTIAPVVTVNGSNPVIIVVGTSYIDEGASATDNVDGAVAAIAVNGSDIIDTSEIGTHTVTYNATDIAGNTGSATRVVEVVEAPDTTAPVITLLGNANVTVEAGTSYTDAGATASDNLDGDITTSIVIGGDTVDTTTPAVYTITYNVMDNAQNSAAQVTRTVTITEAPDTAVPVITLLGDANVTVEAGTSYTDAGATALDNEDGDLTAAIVVVGSVNVNVPATYILTYNVQDSVPNAAIEVTRTVIVSDTIAPTITLIGDAELVIQKDTIYSDAGATASDSLDGDITGDILVDNSVNTNTPATYVITYNVSDSAGNPADAVTRTVRVNAPPTANAGTDVSVEIGNSVDLVGSGSDTEGAVTYQWSEGGNVFATTASSEYTPSTVGTYTLTLTVTDSEGATATDAIVVTATEDGQVVFVTCRSTPTTEAAFTDIFINMESSDRPWPDNLNNVSLTVDDIANVFNTTRGFADPFGQQGKKLVMPTQVVWNGYTDSQKALFLVNSERCARGILPYEGVSPLVETSTAQYYADYLSSNNVFGHNEDGNSAWERLELLAGVITQGDSANADFFSYAENLAQNSLGSTGANPIVHEPVAKAIYAWMYNDKESTKVNINEPPAESYIYTYGHRKFILAKGLVENSGDTNKEGLIGIGVSTVQETVNGINWTKVYTVMNAFDPNENWPLGSIQTVDVLASNQCLDDYTPVNNPDGSATLVCELRLE